MIFAWMIDFSSVIARESGRSSNHKILRDYWMPRFRGHDRGEAIHLSKGIALKASRLNSYASALTAGLRLQRLHIRLAAQRHDRDLAGAEIRKNHLHRRAVALQERNVARLCATRRQVERGPGGGLGIVAQRPVGAPQIGPDVVLAVDRHVIRLLPAG